MESLDFSQLLEDPNPVLFKSDVGYAISFFLTINDGDLKKNLTKLIWKYGGRVETSYDNLLPRTVLLVDKDSYRPNFYDRIEFNINYVMDCIKKNELLPLNAHAYARKVVEPAKLFYDVVYYRTRVFKCIDKMDAQEKTFTILATTPQPVNPQPDSTKSSVPKSSKKIRSRRVNCDLCKCSSRDAPSS